MIIQSLMTPLLILIHPRLLDLSFVLLGKICSTKPQGIYFSVTCWSQEREN